MRDRRRRRRWKHVKPLQLAAQINTCSQGERATVGRICFYSPILFSRIYADWVNCFFLSIDCSAGPYSNSLRGHEVLV